MRNPKKTKKKINYFILRKSILFSIIIFIFAISILIGTTLSKFIFNKSSETSNLSDIQLARKIDDLCKSSSEKDQCFGSAFYKITKKSGSTFALEVLKHLQKIDPQNSNGCHFIAHKISQAEVAKNPKMWDKIIQDISPSLCTGGFLHGVLEAHMATDPSFAINEQSFKTVCDKVYEKHRTWFAWRGCVHNMGHLMLVEQQGNIEKAINECDKITHKGIHYECLSGTFMEKVTGENLVAHGLLNKIPSWDMPLEKEMEDLCGKYSETQARACWKVISYVYFATSNHNPKGLYEKCQRAPEKNMRDECFIYGAGNLVATTRFEQSNLKLVCHQFMRENPLFEPCMGQIIGSLLTSTTDNLAKTANLCSNSYEDYKQICYNLIIDVLKRNKAPLGVIADACKKVPENMQKKACNK